MFLSDQPITSDEEDSLDRKDFACSLGDAILSYKYKDSVAIGLLGPWGCGKTSILNMAIENIESKTDALPLNQKPIILYFNPWNFSDQNQIIYQFFHQLSDVLKKPDYAEGAKEAGKKLATYSKFFTPLSYLPTIGPIAKLISQLLEDAGSAANEWGEMKESDLYGLKKEITDLLNTLTQKIIIVIDDIDRLNKTEIRQVFQLVKSLADFPNTIYFLVFDKDVVIKALEDVQTASGLDYLEKVVQIPFETPQIPQHKLEKYLRDQVDEIIRDVPENEWDRKYKKDIYQNGLKDFFRNLRDIKRFINCLKFSFDLIKEHVNTIDLLAITALQIFEPDIYSAIKNNKDLLTGVLQKDMFDSDYELVMEQTKKSVIPIFGRKKRLPEKVLEEFIETLFPKIHDAYNSYHHSEEYIYEWRKKCRICSPGTFDRYFKLSTSGEVLTQREVLDTINLAKDYTDFKNSLLSMIKNEEKATQFLDMSEDYIEEDIPEANIPNIIKVLIDLGDLFPEAESDEYRLQRIMYHLSLRISDKEERFNLFKNAIKNAKESLLTLVDCVWWEDIHHARYNLREAPTPENKQLFTDSQLDEIEKIASDKIKKWDDSRKLLKTKYLLKILFIWKTWGHKEEVEEFVKTTTQDKQGVIDFISCFLFEESREYIHGEIVKRKKLNIEHLRKYVDLKEIEPLILKIASSEDFEKLDNDKQLAVKLLLAEIDKNKQKNKETEREGS